MTVGNDSLTQTDRDHLNLLSIFHYVGAGLLFVFSCFPILHLVMGLSILMSEGEKGSEGIPEIFGLMFVLIPLVMIICGWVLTICMIMTARFLKQGTRYTFCLVVSGVECIFMPIGTVLGIFSIIVLSRPTVKKYFGYPPEQFSDKTD